MAAVLPGREEVSVVSAALSSRDDSGEVGPSSLSDDDSLEDSRASKAEDRRPVGTMGAGSKRDCERLGPCLRSTRRDWDGRGKNLNLESNSLFCGYTKVLFDTAK